MKFATLRAANSAVQKYNGYEIAGSNIAVMFSKRFDSRSEVLPENGDANSNISGSPDGSTCDISSLRG